MTINKIFTVKSSELQGFIFLIQLFGLRALLPGSIVLSLGGLFKVASFHKLLT
jgi:hypothetical protein